MAPLTTGGSSITNYKIYKRTATTETLLATVSNVLSYNDIAVTNGQTYYYRVTAVNSVGESAKSNEASAIPAVPTAGTLNIAVTTDKPSYTRGSFVILTITVKNGVTGAAMQGSKASVQLFNPSGLPLGSFVVTTGSSGTALAGIGFSSTIPTGTYMLRVTVSLAGYESKTAQTTFTLT